MLALRAFLTDDIPVSVERWQFADLPITIGRNPQNEFAVRHPAVSNFHARLEYHDGRPCIRDLGSRNGVYVAPAVGGDLTRIPPNSPVELSTLGDRFYLSALVLVQMEFLTSESCSHPTAPGAEPAVLGPRSRACEHSQFAHAAQGRLLADPQVGAECPPQSRYLNVSLDSLALQGLRELVRSLLPERQLETTGDIARLITKLHDVVDVFCRTLLPLRQGFEQFVSSLDLEMRRRRRISPAAAHFEVAQKPEQVALALLDPREPSADAVRAAESLLTDLTRHQVALLEGVMQGVRALLDEISPEKIEAVLDERDSPELFGARYRARWAEFCQRHQRLSDQREVCAVIFGDDFADVYRRSWQREPEPRAEPR